MARKKKKEENLEEESSMANGASAGYSRTPGKRNQKSPTIFREEDEEEADEQKDLIEEMILREIIFEAYEANY